MSTTGTLRGLKESAVLVPVIPRYNLMRKKEEENDQLLGILARLTLNGNLMN